MNRSDGGIPTEVFQMFAIHTRSHLILMLSASAFVCGPLHAGIGDEPKYVGTKTCKKCHFETWESWSRTRMARSFNVLKPDAQLEVDKKKKIDQAWIDAVKARKPKGKPPIDPTKDHTRDANCVKCHVTGFGGPKGYAIPDPKSRKARRTAEKLEGVGCESCHGPGSEYVKVFKDIFMKQRPYSIDELRAAGLKEISRETCLQCHTTESPFVGDDYVFDYEKNLTKGIHAHVELKLRKK